MGCCTGRCFLITVCFLLLLATLERQVFDFLGYMWAPIIGNFLQIIYVIVGLFGAFQYRPKFLIVYAVWCLVWIGWNIFVICLYLEVGILTRESSILNIGTGNKSWWLDHGIGCTVTDVLNQSTTSSTATGTRYIPPEEAVTGCLLRYYYVEIIHAGIQCLLTLLAFCASCYVIHIFTEEDDSSPAAQVNDEIEFIKMRYKSPSKKLNRSKVYETTSFPAETSPTTPEPPPRQPIERNAVHPERRSHRSSKRPQKKSTSTPLKLPSKAPSRTSIWSKGSSTPNENSRTTNDQPKNLPWVHIAPSPQRGGTDINTSLDSESSPPAYDSHEEYNPRLANGAPTNRNNSAQLTNRISHQPSVQSTRQSSHDYPVEPPRPVSYKPSVPPVVPPVVKPPYKPIEPPRPYQLSSEPPKPRAPYVRTGSSGRSKRKDRPPLHAAVAPVGANRKLDYIGGNDPLSRGGNDPLPRDGNDPLPSYRSENRQPSYAGSRDSYTESLPSFPEQRAYSYTDRELPLPPPPSDLDNNYDGTDHSSGIHRAPPNPNELSQYDWQQRPPVASNPLYLEANQHSRYPPPVVNPNNRYNPSLVSGGTRHNRYAQQDSRTSDESVHSGNVYFRGQGASHV